MGKTLTPRVAVVGLLITLAPLVLLVLFFAGDYVLWLFAQKGQPQDFYVDLHDGAGVGVVFSELIPSAAIAGAFVVYLLRNTDSLFNAVFPEGRPSARRVLWYLGAAFSISIFSWKFLAYTSSLLFNMCIVHHYLCALFIIYVALFLYLIGRKSPLVTIFTLLYSALFVYTIFNVLFANPGASDPVRDFISSTYLPWQALIWSFIPFLDRSYLNRGSPVFKSIIRAFLLAGAAFAIIFTLNYIPLYNVATFGFLVAYLAFLAALFFQTLALAWIVVESGQS